MGYITDDGMVIGWADLQGVIANHITESDLKKYVEEGDHLHFITRA